MKDQAIDMKNILHFEKQIRSHLIVNRAITDWAAHDKIVTQFAVKMNWFRTEIGHWYQFIWNDYWDKFYAFLDEQGYLFTESPWPPSPFPHLPGTQCKYSHTPRKPKSGPVGVGYDPYEGTVADDL